MKQLMKLTLAVGLGSFIGGVFRYLLSQAIHAKFLSTFPFGTLAVNIIGCLFIGMVFELNAKGTITQEWRLFLATGILGGFTTFSAFSNETVGLLRDGQIGYASIYVVASVLIGLVCTFIGMTFIKLF